MKDEKTPAPITSERFKRLRHMKDQLYKVEFGKTEIEHKETIIVVILIRQ